MSGKLDPVEAEAPKWILDHALEYRVRPIAVLRELLQNATDAITVSGRTGFIEVAILCQDERPAHGQYHLVIRDFAEGICEEEFDYVRIMGRTSKPMDGDTIGRFGVGIYSVHAVTERGRKLPGDGEFLFLSQK